MNRKVLFLVLSILTIGLANAQQQKIIVQSQYEIGLKEGQVKVLRTGEVFNTDKDGNVVINASPEDSISVLVPGFSTDPVALSSKNEEGIVKVNKSFSWKDLLSPMFYIINGGLWLILFIVFAETGLFAGFFLPGDSLLFVSGIYSEELARTGLGINLGSEFLHLALITLLVIIAAIIGNEVGYWFGRKSGPSLYHRKDTFLFKKKYLIQAHDFFEKKGASTIVIARFLPIIRTFAPIVAGIVKMDKKTFTMYNIIGSVAWAVSMMFGGHYLYKVIKSQFDFDLKAHLEIIVLVIVLLTTVPVIFKFVFGQKVVEEVKDTSWMDEED